MLCWRLRPCVCVPVRVCSDDESDICAHVTRSAVVCVRRNFTCAERRYSLIYVSDGLLRLRPGSCDGSWRLQPFFHFYFGRKRAR
jgi:hypothetical protein